MNVGKIATGALNTVKRNPELALVLLSLFAPKAAAKVAEVYAAVQGAKAAT